MKYVRLFLRYSLFASILWGQHSHAHKNIKKEFLESIECGRLEKVKELFRITPDELRNYQGKKLKNETTALMYAARHRQTEIFDFMLLKGASLAKENKFNESVLMFAAKSGAQDIVQRIIDLKGPLNKVSLRGGKNALHYALGEENYDAGHRKTASLLVDAGIDLTVVNGDGATPFYNALEKADFFLIEKILKRTSLEDKNSQKPFSEYFINFQVPRLLTTNLANYSKRKTRVIATEVKKELKAQTATMYACEIEADIKVIKALTQTKGFNPKIIDIHGDPALFYAIRSGNIKNTLELLNSWYEPEFKNKKDQTALQLCDDEGMSHIKSLIEDFQKKKSANSSSLEAPSIVIK